MNELSLFSGAGGGLLGSKLLGWKTLGYVEYEPYCQEILKARIADGILDAAPIFGDIRKFISEGYADAYQGMVDIVTGGFPCQPFSVAGKGLGEADPRNMWPSTIEVIRRVRPRFAFLENVPGLLTDPYMGRIFGDLAQAGYDAEWGVLGASDVGAPHRRKRLWILAYSESKGLEGRTEGVQPRLWNRFKRCRQDVADSTSARRASGRSPESRAVRDEIWSPESERRSCYGAWWSAEPNVGGTFDGLAARVDIARTDAKRRI